VRTRKRELVSSSAAAAAAGGDDDDDVDDVDATRKQKKTRIEAEIDANSLQRTFASCAAQRNVFSRFGVRV